MKNFDEVLKEEVQKQIIQSIHKANLLQFRFDDGLKLPESFIKDCWDLIDQDDLKAKLASKLESELADRLVNSIAAEIATDIKSVLSIPERRESVRAVVRDNIDKLCGKPNQQP